MSKSKSVIEDHPSREEARKILVKKTWMTGVQAAVAGLFLGATHYEPMNVLQMEIHWSLTAIVSVALIFNLLAFGLNLKLLKARSEEDSLFDAMQPSGPVSESESTENYMDDPEVKALMDRVVKKSKSL